MNFDFAWTINTTRLTHDDNSVELIDFYNRIGLKIIDWETIFYYSKVNETKALLTKYKN